MKRPFIFCLFLFFLLLLSACNPQNQVVFDFDEQTNTISGVNFDKIEILYIPSEINEIPVYSIGSHAFENKEIEELTIAEGITAIGDYAFANNFIKTLDLPSSLNTLGNFAFANNKIETLSTDYIESIYEKPFLNNDILQYVLSSSSQTENMDWMILRLGLSIELLSDVYFQDGFYFILEAPMIVGYDISYGADVVLPATFILPNSASPSTTMEYSFMDIGPYAFYDVGLTSVQMADNYTSVSAYAFAHNSLTECPVCYRDGGIPVGVGVGGFLDNQITEFVTNTDIYISEDTFIGNPINHINIKGNPFYYFGNEDYYGLPKLYEFEEFDSSTLPVFETDQGWYKYFNNYLYLVTETEISIFEISEGVNNLLYTLEIDSSKKMIVDIYVNEDGKFYLLGFNIPEGADSNTYLPGFIMELESDFSSYEFFDLDNTGMRIPRGFTVNNKNEFGVYGEGSDQDHAYAHYAFMIFDELYQRLYSYELTDYYSGQYREILAYKDTFFLTAMVSNQEICSNSECDNLLIQKFNSTDFLLDSKIIEKAGYEEVYGLFINDEKIFVLLGNSYEYLEYYELDISLEITLSQEYFFSDLFMCLGMNYNDKFYVLVRTRANFAIMEITNANITFGYFDSKFISDSPFDLYADLYFKLLVTKYND